MGTPGPQGNGYSTWMAMFKAISVKAYGAVGNGVQDDTAAIQAAIDAVGATGGVVYLPPGTYVISNTLTITHPGVTIRGSGSPFPNGTSPNGLSEIVPATGTYDVFKVAGTGHFTTIENLVINPSAAMTGGYVFNIEGTSSSSYLQQPTLRNICAQNVWGGISTVNVQAGEYGNLIFQGVYGPYGWYATNWTLPYLNFVVISASSATTTAYYWSGNVGSVVAFNVSQDNAGDTAQQAFYLSDVADSDFYSCTANGTTDSQIKMVDCADIRWTSLYAYYGQSHGIEIDNSSGIFLIGGEIEDNAGAAVLLNGTTGQTLGVRISSLIMAASGSGSTSDSGVMLQNNVSQIGISNCLIDGNGIWQHGILDQTTASPAFNDYTGNSIWNTTEDGIVANGGTSTLASGNAGYNPVGAVTPPASPLISGTVYQNTLPVPLTIYQPGYAAEGGTAGSIAVSLSNSNPPATLFTQWVSGSTTSELPEVIQLRVPPGWYYGFTASGATLSNAQIQGE